MKKIINALKQAISKIDKNFYSILLVFLIILNIAPVLAPILAALKLTFPAQVLYFIYSFFCHQLDWRSLHIFDFQYAWCVRDTFIWSNLLVIGLLVKKYQIKPLKWYWLVPFVVPIALDGGIQTIATVLGYMSAEPFYMSTDFTRMITGAIFGIGFGLWIMPNMWESSYYKEDRKIFNIKTVYLTLIMFILDFLIYIILVAVWNWTSPVNKPSNFLDYSVKTPINTEDWLIRRAHGV